MKRLWALFAFAIFVAAAFWTSSARAGDGGNALTISPTSFSFAATAGSTTSVQAYLAVSAARKVNFSVSASGTSGERTWLSVSPSGNLVTPKTLTVSANPSGLSAGSYNGTISLKGDGSTVVVPVTLVVSAAASTLTVSPTSLSFSATAGSTSPGTQNLSLSASPNTAFTASVSDAAWLKVSTSSGTTPTTLTVSSNVTGLATGTYIGTITVTGNGLTRSVPVTFSVSSTAASGGSFKLVAWNDLGMHCFDGKDYSVFAVLPPYNTIHAHLVDTSGSLVSAPGGYTITYHAVTDPLTSTINTTSASKTNFWNYVSLLGLGSPLPDEGLKGFSMPGTANTPQPMSFSQSDNTWMASGVPVMPYADNGTTNYFPIMRITATNSSGAVLATTDIVLPTSDEMTCSTCHASQSNPAAMPSSGWVNASDPARDTKLNILRKHDDRFQSLPLFQSAATQVGYNPAGLEATVATKPVLCYQCHLSNALGMTGISGIQPLTTAMHGLHAGVIDPATGTTMDSATTRASCYNCHPGPKTQCLRGPMGNLLTSTGKHAI